MALSSPCALGFAVFFTIFELTRRLAVAAKDFTQHFIQHKPSGMFRGRTVQRHGPRIVHALTLVTGGAIAGLAYELSCRPWDVARKAVRVDRVVSASQNHSVTSVLISKIHDEGWLVFFKHPVTHEHHEPHASPLHRRMHALGRTLARVGPWGVGFLAWEAFGPGLS